MTTDSTPVLVHGDARELSRYVEELTDGDIKCVVTSPPYKDSGGYSEELIQSVAKEFDKMRYPGPVFLNFGDLTAHPWRAHKTAKLFCEWGDMYLMQTIIWVKNHFTPRHGARTFDSKHEYIFYIVGDYDNPPRLRRREEHVGVPYVDKSNVGRYSDEDVTCPGTVWYIPYDTITKRAEKLHPHRYPVALPLRAISSVMEPGGSGTVADPFSGSGTTLVATQQLRVNSLAVEMDPTYIDITVERLGGDVEVVDYDPDKKVPFKRV